jgi:hypothetical protein
MPKWTWRCPLRLTFFGLDDKYIENIYEQFFFLKYHGNWSLQEAYSLPVKIRSWFVMKLSDQLKMEQEALKKK